MEFTVSFGKLLVAVERREVFMATLQSTAL